MPRKINNTTQPPNFNVTNDECGFDQILGSIQKTLPKTDSAFYHVSLCSVLKQFERWRDLLPRVAPFFAVKCQPDPQVIRLLGSLGTGFDCASREEIKIVIKTMQWGPEMAARNIIYANPFKFKKDMEFARLSGVELTTFDSESELVKLASEWPTSKLVLRVSPERQYDATCVLGNKFGADASELPGLFQRTRELGMDIVGISFHVGSGCKEMDAFPETVQFCSRVFQLAAEFGFLPYLLDIGGGFPGNSPYMSTTNQLQQIEFEQMTLRLNEALAKYFPSTTNDGRELRIIAEPGRYFVSGAYTLATQVIGKKTMNLLDPNSSKSIVACSINNDAVHHQQQQDYNKVFNWNNDTPSIGNHDTSSLSQPPHLNHSESISGECDSALGPSHASSKATSYLDLSGATNTNTNIASVNGATGSATIPPDNTTDSDVSWENTSVLKMVGDMRGFRYVLNDGVYNSFNNILYDHAKPQPVGKFSLNSEWTHFTGESIGYISTLYGPTCDGFDCILRQVNLPEHEMGDWLVWPDMGAYTGAASSGFNGIQKPLSFYEFCQFCYSRSSTTTTAAADSVTKNQAACYGDKSTKIMMEQSGGDGDESMMQSRVLFE